MKKSLLAVIVGAFAFASAANAKDRKAISVYLKLKQTVAIILELNLV